MEKHFGILLDVSYSFNEKKQSFLSLCVKTKKGKEFFFERGFFPYFYVIVDDAKKRLPEIESHLFANKFPVRKAAIEKKSNAENVIKLSFNNTEELKEAREEVKKFPFVLERHEYDIPFTKRYLLDTGLAPMNGITLETKNGSDIENAKPFDADEKDITGLCMAAFDLETHSPGRFSNPLKDPIISIAMTAGEKELVFAWRKDQKKDASVFFESEKEVAEEFVSQMEKTSPDIVVTYNGDSFDFPYLAQRCKKLGVELKRAFFGHEPRLKRMGLDNAYRINGVQHLDAYKVIRVMNRFGVVNLVKFDLESVSDAIFGANKKKVDHNDINLAWETGKGMKEVIDYNREDATYTYRIAQRYLLLYAELCRLSHETLFEASRSGASSLVEDLLMAKAFELNALVPNKPEEGEVKKRMLQSFKGGYVKEPVPGLHENIAVLDFRSLHPSIMISHNVSPETLRCTHGECMEGKNVSPDKDWFCMKQKGFIPTVLEEILEKRVQAKKGMKKTSPKDPAYALFASKQQALKILLNSHYGYLGYPRSRWYSRQCAKAITAWSRHYIRDINIKAEQENFIALYTDTDSAFLKVPKEKTKEDVLEFVKKMNSELPGAMELEFEGYYRRGIFVTKREGGAAKKRYALLDFDGNLKIVGFEYVRRDWAKIAKDTQRQVLQAVLELGSPQKAIELVKDKIKKLREGKVEKKDLIVLTQIKKPLKSYESIGPHVAAAKKAVARGKEIEVGSTVSFIITKNGKSISDRAELEEFVKEGNYDADYYIEHQLIPAVIRIIAELGVSKEDLVQGGKQKSLEFFS
ncbi:MAG: ribonuclease H-like domain-containing protein [Candidatus Diapherotrites archaeon]|nr:ribonuclease H-like domain-containing protein [Candidatus Diapherotrites archaeon]